MKFLIVTGCGEPQYSTNASLIAAFKALGCEVWVCGPGYWDRCFADAEMPDRPYPERYTYREVLDLCPWSPDLILQIEPHFFLSGPKPQGVKSGFLFTDPHRGGAMQYQMAKEGHFDYVFVGQKYFLPLFFDVAPRVYSLPVGFDSRRIQRDHSQTPLVDISFCGQTGIAFMEYLYEDDIGRYATHPPARLPAGPERYKFSIHPGYDYAERAEMLIRLCRDFSVRMYEPILYNERYQQTLQVGVVGFHRSLLKDISIRCFEVMAAGRVLITDRVPFQEELFQDSYHCLTYDTYFKPFFQNFDLEYEQVAAQVRQILRSSDKGGSLALRGQDWVWQGHTWKHRAQTLLDSL